MKKIAFSYKRASLEKIQGKTKKKTMLVADKTEKVLHAY